MSRGSFEHLGVQKNRLFNSYIKLALLSLTSDGLVRITAFGAILESAVRQWSQPNIRVIALLKLFKPTLTRFLI